MNIMNLPFRHLGVLLELHDLGLGFPDPLEWRNIFRIHNEFGDIWTHVVVVVVVAVVVVVVVVLLICDTFS